MKLIINAASVFKGGAEQVLISFINECRNFEENIYHVFLRDNIITQLNADSFPSNFIFHRFKYRPASGLNNYFKSMKAFNVLEKEIDADCVISTGGHGYWRPEAPLAAGFNIPHFIYPESPFFNNMTLKKKVFWAVKKKINLIYYGRADALFVQTADVKERLEKLLPGKPILVIPNTVNGYFLENPTFKPKLPDREKGEVRFITVSSYYPHKNLEIINGVIRELVKLNFHRAKFVLTLPEDIFLSKFDSYERTFIYNVGPTPIKECPSLYEECDFMFLPTLLECFSASYAEAMAMEKPILTSDLGFAHTVCKDAAIYFDPVNPSEISEKIINLVIDEKRQDELIEAGKKRMKEFGTAEDRATEYLSICKQLSLHGKDV